MVFHISQIEKVCKKYNLRFLNVRHYTGKVCPELANKILNFELANGTAVKRNDCFIVAPKESFTLQKKDRDPLFFVKVADDHYYLVHKWGNDLNWTRAILPFLTSNLALILGLLCALCVFSSTIGTPIPTMVAWFTGVPLISVSVTIFVDFMFEGQLVVGNNIYNPDLWNTNEE